MPQYPLYKGAVLLDYDDRKHIYSVDGKVVFGVTSILNNVLSKPALLYWAVNQSIEYLEKNLKPGKILDEIQIKNLLEEARTMHRKKSTKAADIGTIGHQWIESYIKARLQKQPIPSRPINKELRRSIDGFFQWAKEVKLTLIASEQKIYSQKYRYAGTLDLDAMANNQRSIIDFKFSNAIYDEYFLQESAYLKAKEEEMQKVYDGGIVILRLSKDNKKDIKPFEVRYITREEVDRHFRTFLYCLGIHRWQMENKKLAILDRVNRS